MVSTIVQIIAYPDCHDLTFMTDLIGYFHRFYGLKPSKAICANYVYIMDIDVQLCVARLSTAMLWILHNKRIHGFHEEGCQPPEPSQFW